MADNEFVGSALFAQWVGSPPGGAVGTVVLNTDYRNFNYRPSLSFIDATAGSDSATKRLDYMKDGQATLSILEQTDIGTVTMNLLAEGVHGTLTWGEAGTATGKPKHVLPAISMGAGISSPYNDVATIDITFQQNGVRVDSVY